MNFSTTAAFVLSVADLLRGDYRQPDHGNAGLHPVPDQVAIAHGWVAAKVDNRIAKARGFINQMREQRTAVISAAVTGKIDVREVA